MIDVVKYTLNESLSINSLSWYNDVNLISIIKKLMDLSYYDRVVDLCSGTSPLLSYFLSISNHYVGVESSIHMLEQAKRCYHSSTLKDSNKKVCFYEGNVLEYLASDYNREQSKGLNCNLFFIKNALQFLEIKTLLKLLIKCNYNNNLHFYLINTVREESVNGNLFGYLKLPFMDRTYKFYNINEIQSELNIHGFEIKHQYLYIQNIDFLTWLSYHNVCEVGIKSSLEKLERLSDPERAHLGVLKRNNTYFLVRPQYLCYTYLNL